MSSAILIPIMFLAAGLVICCLGEEVNTTFGCIATEMNALIKFKTSFLDPYDRLSSWNSRTNIDCCKWQGIKCDTITGHVIGLDFRNEKYDPFSSVNMLFSEKLDSSIIELNHLSSLDLSGNDFQYSSIPAFLGSMNQLQHLNLSRAYFGGIVPHHLGNLSRLTVLDLSYNGYYTHHSLIVDDFMWVSRLSLLTHLDMSFVNLIRTIDLLKVLNFLPYIVDLRLADNKLENRNLQHVWVNFTTLPNIQVLNLSINSFVGELPCFLPNMTSLRVLDLSYNSYDSCSKFDLTRLTNLVSLSLSSNLFQCTVDRISEFLLPNKCHLIVLNLGFNSFYGDISKIFHFNSSRCWNQKLAFLVLASNQFYGQLPEEVGGFKKLEYLSLSYNLISGHIPTSITNLTGLTGLSLSFNKFNGQLPEEIGGFKKLKYLTLSLNLISGPIPTSITNLTALTILSLANNKFNSSIPFSLGNLTLLEVLGLYGNQLSGEIPSSSGNLTSLKVLDLNYNQLSGEIPSSFGNLTSLEFLGLQDNQLSGEIPTSFGQLQNLYFLSFRGNYFHGTISEDHFAMLSKLKTLAVGDDLTKLRVRSDWTPPFQLDLLVMQSIDVGGQFPEWLRTQNELTKLYMSGCGISGPIPDWFRYRNLIELYLSNNHIEGSLPDSLCEMNSLKILYLSKNKLSGNLPECWANLTKLNFLILSSNQLSGVIPNSITGTYSLIWLQLSNNSFIGELPSTLRNCTQLSVLDIGYNAISGKLPKWIGNYLVNLEVLRLTNNELYGKIPIEICQLFKLHILDLANNKLTGNIPRCFCNFSEMVTHDSVSDVLVWFSLQEVMKGFVMEYRENLRYLVNMDLSNNDLVGEIPLELTRLVALKGLNLSHNHIQGMVPGRIGDMKSLESLDLSNNNLFGNIPKSLSELTFLSRLNLSHNNLGGEIPQGPQLQTLEPTSFQGNPGLCGDPLPKKCHGNKAASTPNAIPTQTEEEKEKEDSVDKIWFYGVVISGFATGFWGAIGVLVFKRGWRFVYFKFVDYVITRAFGR